MNIEQHLAGELGVGIDQVRAAVALLDEGASVPFIARYRKEATGALDDTCLRQLHQRLDQLRELESRREAILKQLSDSGQLDDNLKDALLTADNRARLEDLYAPYRPKRRNRAQQAREAGLAPLADQLLQQPGLNAERAAQAFIAPDRGIDSSHAALEGARHILIEYLAESADLLETLRTRLWGQGLLRTRAARGKADPDSKFRDYFDYAEPIARIPSHRALALLRGEQEGVLKYKLEWPEGQEEAGVELIRRHWQLRRAALSDWMQTTLSQCWSRKLHPQLESELVRPTAGAGGRYGHSSVRSQSAGSAAGPSSRCPHDAGAGPWVENRGQGGGGRCHRTIAGIHHHLPPPSAQAVGSGPGHPGPTLPAPPGRADRRR